ncbi:MAG: cupin domain-containing protein [Methylococcaceae bacterium]|nr:cupin domain-containing protein [Methylococcaceae bacterium]
MQSAFNPAANLTDIRPNREWKAYRSAAVAVMLALASMTLAHADDPVKVHTLFKQTLPDAPGKQLAAQEVEFPPGPSAPPHYHPGSVLAYVLQGSVVSQLEGVAPITYSQGQIWYESPKQPHLVIRNASLVEPAKLMVYFVIPLDSPATLPLETSR